MTQIRYCPGTLAEGFNTYSQACLRRLYNGKRVNHILPYNPPEISEEDAEKFINNRTRISISGVQEKVSLLLDKNKLRLTEEGEQGTYILKPIPRDLKKADQVPANEHLTMQIARQVYGINTAENALIFFKDGSPAYITKRFDIKPDGTKWGKEDFATLAGKTSENTGPNFKYGYSYEEMAKLIRKFVPAAVIEMEKFFSMVLFNYLFSNGDAHLKNFSLLQTANGDYILSPAYDLINTRIHVDDTDFALNEGLFEDEFESAHLQINGKVGREDFQEFARRVGINERRRDFLISPFLERQALVEELISRSFLDEPTKRAYLLHYQTRRNQ
ncbi:type II toxin-antitoxin system HipA family toxin [Fulvivirga sp. M361]|uniref:type II toxin-antitoxin system HipA family toxin n=1 Tax=Fulvivirga sp. M361 TaxID=2594266 RepID=UPI0021066B2F|nr:HipA domain-containing protein [Fulvivirga sp. M361]